MNKIILQTIIVFVFCGVVFGAESSVSWIPGDNPQDFSRFPANPTTNDIITFIVPTDVYFNRWDAEQALGGTPTIEIDTAQKRIELVFEPPAPEDPIPSMYDPVRGLQGYFGPLEEGSWIFFTQFPGTIYIDPFEVTFEAPAPIISGRIQTFDGLGINNVTVFFSNRVGIAFTDNNGNYSKEVPHGWTGTVMPIKSGFTFDPPSRTYSNVTTSRPGQNYEGTEEKPPGPANASLTEQFVSSEDAFDLDNTSILFTPAPDGTSYTAEVEPISQIPTLPAGGTNLAMGDDDYKFVKLSGSASVSIYGDSYTGIYVGSNGYITFSEGDTAFTDSLSNHFSLQRVSGLFRDLDPTAGGQISYRQLADRIAVTWRGIPEYNSNNSNIFQIELFFDGTIRLSWLDIDIEIGIVGLSEGLGIPPDFVETDFTELAPPPPTTKYFTEQFLSGDTFDLSNRTILFSPTNDSAFYTATVEHISQLPTDPSGGINLGLGDDDYKFVKLSGSAAVSIYDNTFTGIYVGSNGYITFTEGDREHSSSLSNHFRLLRVSGLFRDLDPSQRGQVTWRQLNNRVVVTWNNVPEYSRNNSNTFQIELFYDGSISISFLGIDAQQGIVGLSDGLGVPTDFQDTDFSELSSPPPPPGKEHLVEQFISGGDDFDLSNMSVMFTPAGSGTSYSAEVSQISQLPTNPSGGTNLALGDDDFASVKLPSTVIVPIYGNSFTGIYVGSNGYVTYTEGDLEYSESLDNHFNALRVSGLFRDLDPTSGGQVSYKHMNDRTAVTWLNVPEYNSNNPNTFQIELFFDGRIRISWLAIGAQNAIVGLSDGEGVPEDFQETDFSELSTQPPPPPPLNDYLTEEFASNSDTFDLEYASVLFTPTSDGSSYVGSLQNISQLPTNPFGGTNIPVRDDTYVQVGLSNQAQVKIFNQSFPRFFVGSNGYITFTHPDQDHSQTLAEHFDTLRISGLYCDLTAANTGSVTGKQFINRVAITWEDVPEFSNTSPNTFQIEMYYDGRIRISWLDIGSRNNIVGLSNGLGLSPDFVETDFSIQYAQP